MRVFFDTNVLVYLFDSDAVEKKERARALFEAEAQAGRALLSTQVLQEFYVTVTRKLAEPLDPATAEKIVRHFCNLRTVILAVQRIASAGQPSRRAGIRFGNFTPTSGFHPQHVGDCQETGKGWFCQPQPGRRR